MTLAGSEGAITTFRTFLTAFCAHDPAGHHDDNEMIRIRLRIIMIIAFKGTNRDFFFYNHLTAARTVSNKWPGCNRVQIKCKTPSAYHVQHVVRCAMSTII